MIISLSICLQISVVDWSNLEFTPIISIKLLSNCEFERKKLYKSMEKFQETSVQPHDCILNSLR